MRVILGRVVCIWCLDKHTSYVRPRRLREHCLNKHKEVLPETLERHIVKLNYPKLDLDKIVEEYKNKLSTMIGLQYRGLFIKHYLKVTGALRHPQADKAIGKYLDMLGPGDMTHDKIMAKMDEKLVGVFRDISDMESIGHAYINRDIYKLKNQGLGHLESALRAIKIIEFAKKTINLQINKMKEEIKGIKDPPIQE